MCVSFFRSMTNRRGNHSHLIPLDFVHANHTQIHYAHPLCGPRLALKLRHNEKYEEWHVSLNKRTSKQERYLSKCNLKILLSNDIRYACDIFLWNKLEQYTVYFVYGKLMIFIACIWNITLVVWKCALKIEAGPWIKWSVVPRSAIALDASRGTRILDYRSSNSDRTTRWRQLTSSLIAWHVEFWSRARREAATRTSSRRPWRRFVPETFAKQGSMFRTMLRTTATILCMPPRHRMSDRNDRVSASKPIFLSEHCEGNICRN